MVEGGFMKRLVVCALLVGCAGDDAAGGGSPIAIEDLGMQLGEVSCQKVFDCCTDAEIMKQFMNITVDGQPITTEEQCIKFTAGFFNGLALPHWQASIAAGRLEYDASAAGGCVAASASLSCTEYADSMSGQGNTSLAGTCRPFLIPKVANDGACSDDNECTSDNCVQTSSSMDGTCKPMPAAGEPCDSSCVDGYYCGYASGQTMDTCLPLKANGTQCTLSDECTSDYCDTTMSPSVCGTKARTCDGR
jgi:hypothetical protein